MNNTNELNPITDTQKKQALVGHAMKYETEREIYLLQSSYELKPENFNQTLHNLLLNYIYNNEFTNETGYEIAGRACDVITDMSLDELKECENEHYTEHASVYISTRLGYLYTYNQDEITDIVNNYNVDIQTACAIWYDERVNELVNQLLDYVNNAI